MFSTFRIYSILLLFFGILIQSCQTEQAIWQPLPSPSELPGGEPNLFVSAEGEAYLSFVAYRNDTLDELQFSKLENGQWTSPKSIAQGSDWFVNWADFPSLVSTQNGQQLAAHYLQKSAEGTYDYDIKITQSNDGGDTWQPAFSLNRDSIAAEHGFVSLLPLRTGRIFATWLDGRRTKSGTTDNHDDHHGGGAMTLRSAIFDSEGTIYAENELDTRICDCCQTSAALTEEGVIVAYRDRSATEIRDIAVTRRVNSLWTAPTIPHADNWEIAGCPVNGPTIIAKDHRVALVWYTAAQGKPRVQLIFSEDNGATFRPSLTISEAAPLGRVGAAWLSDGSVAVSWLEKTEEGAEIRVQRVNNRVLEPNLMVKIPTSPSRQSGFPILAAYKNGLLLAWTEVQGEETFVRTGMVLKN